MNIELLPEKIEKLESVFLNILYLKPEDRVISPDMSILGDLKAAINAIFDDNMCINVIYTNNTDKQFFGIRINPNMSPSDAAVILTTDEKVKLNKYQIEFDSKLFDIGLNETELAAVTIYEISSMMDDYDIFDKIRLEVDKIMLRNEDIVHIRESVNYAQLIIFALKDTLFKLSSLLFVENPEDLTMNVTIQACNLENYIVSARDKIDSSLQGLGETLRQPGMTILTWMFTMYRNMNIYSGVVKNTLKDARSFTASKLEINEIEKTLTSVDRIEGNVLEESCNLNQFFDKKHVSCLNEFSIFKSLKKNGLRGIENDLYEYAMKVKNCTESEDAFMIMRGINTRLGVLEDYLATEDLNDSERKHWEHVCNQYRELRIALSKKKFKEKSYGLWFDYSKLDEFDKKNEE